MLILPVFVSNVGIHFIDPNADQIAKMGDKAVARRIAKEAGVPMLPGTSVLATYEDAAREARK